MGGQSNRCGYLETEYLRLMTIKSLLATVATGVLVGVGTGSAWSGESVQQPVRDVPDSVINAQRADLLQAASGAHSGPQSPRDLDSAGGTNPIVFGSAPNRKTMNLCNIHLHEAAEHRGGEFTTYVGNGNGRGYGTGYRYNGVLSASELKPLSDKAGHAVLQPGTTIEVHFVHSTAHVGPGPTLASCLSKENGNPQLRVETVVAVLVNDPGAADFVRMTHLESVNGYSAAPNIPDNLGRPINYSGSTTGPSFNTVPSPLQVTWSVRPKVVKVNAVSVNKWMRSNPFKEDHAHGVRNLVTDPVLLSPILAAE